MGLLILFAVAAFIIYMENKPIVDEWIKNVEE